MDSSTIQTLQKVIHESLNTSPTSGNGYGLALTSFALIAITFVALFVMDRHKQGKQFALANRQREQSVDKLHDLIERKFKDLSTEYKDSHSQLREELLDEIKSDRMRITSIERDLGMVLGYIRKQP